MTDTMKEVIVNGTSPEAIRRQMIADGQTTLQKDAIRLVAEGKTRSKKSREPLTPEAPKKDPRKPGQNHQPRKVHAARAHFLRR